MISGSADVAIGVGPPVLFELVGQGAEVKAIDSPMRITDYFMVMGKGKGDTLKDLAGKRIAISTPGSMPHLLPQMILKKNGIDPSGIAFIAIGSMSARLQAIIAGKVDASIVDTQATLVGGNDIVIITSVPEQFPEGLAYGYTVVSASSLKNPSTRKALVALNRGVMRAVKGIYADPDRAAEVMYERLQHSLDLNLLKQIVRRLNSLKIWGEGLGVEAGVYDFTLKTYLEANTISKSVPYESAVDPTIEADAAQSAK
jgi:NitT/TauT family transport system substrate-binding protein